MSRPSQTLRQRALKAMLTEAFFDWKSAVVVGLTMILAAFAHDFEIVGWTWQGWYWLVGGAAAWGALMASMLSDPAFGARVVANMLRRECNPDRLHDQATQAKINKALEYRQRIAEAFARARKNVLPQDLLGLESQIDDWIANMYSLAARLDAYQHDAMIRQDLQTVPQAIQALQAKLRGEDDEAVREQMQRTLDAKQGQLASLRQLQSMMEKAELQMDSTMTALGTVYSQLLLVGAKDIDSGRAQRLSEDIGEQVGQLHDLVGALDEVYAHRA